MKAKTVLAFAVLMLLCVFGAEATQKKPAAKATVANSDAVRRKEIDAFNDEFKRAILAMDNAATMALWDEDGTTLLPGQAAVTGKANIAKWLDGVTDKMKGWKVVSQDNEFHDIQIHGDWASEWATTKQVSQPPEGKKFPMVKKHGPVEANGKMLLVLHRGSDGKWKIREEAWTSSQ